ncbi:MAG: hypothetical protein IJO48_00755 [Clostridia bacterium]|nr:hypothetical protein [Clostridia bacterium]
MQIFVILIVIFVIWDIVQKNRQRKQAEEFNQKRTVASFDEHPKSEHHGTKSPLTHTVRPFTETGHIHTESSIDGIQECDIMPHDVSADVSAPAPSEGAMSCPIDLSGTNAAKGIIYSEILGKPKALRR